MVQKRISFDILDSIRGIAALYVAIAHCRGSLWIGGAEFMRMFPREGWSTADYAMFGASMLTRLAVEFVIVFFVLSGFSIAHSLSSNTSAVQFWKRRLIRIYPSYLVAIIWAGLVYGITKYWHPEWYNGDTVKLALSYGIEPSNIPFQRSMEMNQFLNGDVIMKNVAYMPAGGYIMPFWSLTYEVLFYLTAPFLLKKTNWYLGISALLFLIGFLLPAQVTALHIPVYIQEFLFTYNLFFATGVIMYKYYEKFLSFISGISKRMHLVSIGIIVLAMYAVNLYFRTETKNSFLVSAVLAIFLIIYFLKYQVRINWLMNVGKFSYTLYITHFATIFLYLGIYWLMVKPEVPFILNYFVWMPAILFALGIAYIQYLLVEKRTKDILNFLRKAPPKKVSNSVAATPVLEKK